MSFDKQNFVTNPNFKFRENPAELRECLGTTFTYDVYKDKQGRTILITPYWNIDKQCNTEGDICQKSEEGNFPDKNGGCSYTDNFEVYEKGKCLK